MIDAEKERKDLKAVLLEVNVVITHRLGGTTLGHLVVQELDRAGQFCLSY